MKRVIQILFICLSILFVISRCQNKQINKSPAIPFRINLETGIRNTAAVQLSKICHDLEYIPLETDSSSMLSSITNVFIDDSSLFVTDGSRLLLFDRTGKFISQIGTQGRDPGEYTYIMDFVADNSGREIYILEPHVVHIYDFNGKHKIDLNIDFPATQFISLDGEGLMFHTAYMPIPSVKQVPGWYLTDYEGKTQIKINSFNRNNLGLIVAPPAPLYMSSGTPHFMETGVDTLQYLDNSKEKPYAIFDPGKLRIEPASGTANNSKVKDKIWIWDIKEGDNYMFVRICWNFSDSITNCIFNKKENEFTVLKENGFVNDIDGGLPFWPKKIQNNKLLIDYVDAFDLIKYYNKNIRAITDPKDNKNPGMLSGEINRLNETSNPVLILASFK